LVEPGTPAGWRRILRARARLIGAGGHMVAPCPHALACPLSAPDWCHFSRRLARSRLHRQAKQGEVPWEDEKYSYVAFSRVPDGAAPMARVLAAPRSAPGRVTLKLCRDDGVAASRTFTRREGEAFRAARRVGWGDPLQLR
ncbi:MAG: methyltransferase type 11, partial [Variibacter sp.]|nr:methyltransferase type 11 [Variibacter sp.]